MIKQNEIKVLLMANVYILLKAVIFRAILIRKTIIKCILIVEQEMPILITQTIEEQWKKTTNK
jgi:hypothetical protein